ncbi:MAG: hypothetical protein IKH30_15400 [Clostridia bacterium]|nr:hypothetical protein [Clostridia bacterium]MBR4539128.1 hypothetical protein [Clostridia bacterium]
MKKFLALLLAMVMALLPVLSLAEETTEEPVEEIATELTGEAGKYIYKDSVDTLATNWNPHTYETTGDAYPADFLRDSLYTFIFNDELHPLEGKEPYAGYLIVPEMAASEPVDVTLQVKAEHPEFGIPESAEKGYAYTIDLNPDCVWEDGTPINADTYVYSMQRLLDPQLKNYRATDYYAGDLSIAGAEAYANGGQVVKVDNGVSAEYSMESLVKGEDGAYTTEEGFPVFLAVDYPLDWTSGNTLKDYVDAYGEAYFSLTNWETLVGMMDENGLIPLTDENYALYADVTTGNPAWNESLADVPNYFIVEKTYEVTGFDTVGCYKTGEYQITLVLTKSLTGFYLYYNLSGNWIVKEDLYEANLKPTGDTFTSTYNTSVETTSSYGPYKLVNYEADKNMHFVRNENWFGYKDGKHVYVDPVDGETYPMYMTDEIDTQVVAQSATRKLMFLKGLLMTYGLQAEDFAEYRNSDYVYFTPGSTIFFLILNGYKSVINDREAAEDFDTEKYDIQTITNLNFRKAVALTYDKEDFAATVSPARSGGYGIIGTRYLYDPETGSRYRDTDQAKKALCDAYSVNVEDFASLDEAAASITGYDPVAAKEFYKAAFEEALEARYITDNDGDGICDQTIRIEYSASSLSSFMDRTIAYLNEKMAEVTKDTPFDGKVEFYLSAPYGNDWSTKIKDGLSDTVLGGWNGSTFNPFGLTDLYVNPSYAYDGKWFDATKVSLTLEIEGEELTTTLKDWSDALNGTTIVIGEKEYNFGADQADVETRLDILAAIETTVLGTYDYLPMLQDAGASLLSQQVYWVVEEFNPVLSRGGIQYMKYNYDEAEWKEFVDSQPDGTLSY